MSLLQVRIRQGGPIPLDANLACDAGEMLALVGPSGSGKTTILKAIAGLYKPEEGAISVGSDTWLDTRAKVAVPTRVRRVGFVFQSYALFPHLSVLANVREAVAPGPATARTARARELLAMVNLDGLDDRLPAALSGGQQQRVALARALAGDPRVLLLDEPFSAVDQATRDRLYEELAGLRRQLRMPVILVTHSLPEASLLADRLCVLHRGRTLQTGTPTEVMTRPGSLEVARLVSLKNVATGMVREHVPAEERTWIDWHSLPLEVRLQQAHPVGRAISWVIPPSGIILHRRDRPARAQHENPVPGRIVRCLPMGDQWQVTFAPDHCDEKLVFTLSAHVASRNGIAEGVPATLSLVRDAIHLIAADA